MTAIQDQVILVTGSTDGIGKQTAHDLAKMGATVLLHGRNRERAEVTLQEIFAATRSDRLEYYLADFSSLADVRRLAQAVRSKHCTLNTLINNAGIGAGHLTDRQRALSQDGYELRFCVNYLAPFLLTHLLLPCLQHTVASRIINVASFGQQPIDFENVMLEQHYDPMQAYCQSKLAGIMFSFDLAEQLKNKGITVNCLNPGSRLNTKMVREMFGEYRGSVHSGADAIIYVATSHQLEGVTGKYFDQMQEERAIAEGGHSRAIAEGGHSRAIAEGGHSRAIAQAYDTQARQKLWQLSKSLCNM